jgi:hypothetical protein
VVVPAIWKAPEVLEFGCAGVDASVIMLLRPAEGWFPESSSAAAEEVSCKLCVGH